MGFASEPVNPGGVACWGFVVYKHNVKLFTGKGVVGEGAEMSNNVAEYSALVKALKKLVKHGWHNEKVVIFSDSQLLVNQMNRLWKAYEGLYYPYYVEAVKLTQHFSNISFVWIPREQNKEADSLSRQAYEEYCKAKGRKPAYRKQHQLDQK